MEREGDSGTNCSWCSRNDPQRLGKRLESMENSGRIETINTTATPDGKTPENLMRLVYHSDSSERPANAGVENL